MKKFTVMLAVLAFACGDDDQGSNGYPCTEEIIYGLKVSVKDAISGEFLNAGVTVIATNADGESEELYTFSEVTPEFYGAAEAEGTYIITVTKEGYDAYTSEPVTVEGGRCHVTTEDIIVGLEPA